MTIEYHIIMIPVYLWDDLKINNLDTFSKTIKIMDGLFQFQLDPKLSTNKKNSSLFSGRLAHIKAEVPFIYDVTVAAKEANIELIQEGINLKIEQAYATKYGIEIISNSKDIFHLGDNHRYVQFCNKIAEVLFKGMNRSHCFEAAIAKVILCDTVSEAKGIATDLRLKKITNELYTNRVKLKPKIEDGVFNFRDEDWPVSKISNPIVALKPEKINNYQTTDEFFFLITMIHCLGKFYSVVTSMKSLSASLEVSCWSLRRLLRNYEAEFCWIQRNFQNIEKKLIEFEDKAMETLSFWSRLATSFNSIVRLYQEYGEDFLNIEWASLKSVLTDERLKKYYTKKKPSEMEWLIVKDIKQFAAQIVYFWTEFGKASASWKDNRRAIVEHHEMVVGIIAIVSAISLEILIKFLFPN